LEGLNVSTHVSRREIISLIAAIPLGVVVAGGVASAADDSSGTKARYKYSATAGPGGKHCAVCALFRAPSSCSVVKGKIAPGGYCSSFVPKTT
jgi:hypothetical protein